MSDLSRLAESKLNISNEKRTELMPEQKVKLCRSFSEEIVQEDELLALFNTPRPIIAYDGFEPSGRMHIAQVGHPLH